MKLRISAENKRTEQREYSRECAREWLLQRPNKGAYNGILTDLHLNNEKNFRKFWRMHTKWFQVKLLTFVEATTKGASKNNTGSKKNLPRFVKQIKLLFKQTTCGPS